jgi:hypothetical protein
MAANDITNGILAGLTKVANLFAQKMMQKVSQNGLPSKISDATSVGTAQQAGDGSFIDVSIDLGKAPMAAAFEWGSGEHATRGTPGKYPIEPRNASVLAIPRARWSNYRPPPDADPVILRHVMHPGVVARPYIAPTLTENKEEFRKIMGQELKAAIMLGVPPVTIIEVKL